MLAVLFVALTVLSSNLLRGARLDLTQNRLYTIAPGTQKIVAGLKEPLNLYLFFSANATANLPALRTYGTRVREILEELASRSDGKLSLTVIDPQPFSEEEDRATEFGLRAVPLGGDGSTLYFGLAATNRPTAARSSTSSIPARKRSSSTTSRSWSSSSRTRRSRWSAWLSSLPMTGGFDPDERAVHRALGGARPGRQLFDMRPLEPARDDDRGRRRRAGGRAPEGAAAGDARTRSTSTRCAADGSCCSSTRSPRPTSPAPSPGNPLAAMGADRASDPGPLLAAWGVDFDRASAIGDLERGLTVSMRQGEPPTRHIGILGLDAASMIGRRRDHRDAQLR